MGASIKVFETKNRLIQQAIDDLEKLTSTEKNTIHWALSGGSTPKSIFQALAEPHNISRINWDKIHFWWVDERCVPANDPESNYGEAKKYLLDQLEISPEHIHAIKGDLPPHQAAIEYIHEMKTYIKSYRNSLPVFDLIWLGMGEDGHTASLFPGQFSHIDRSWATVANHPESGQCRITLTLPVINLAKEIVFVVTGESKAQRLKTVLSGSDVSLAYPAANVKANNGTLKWYTDREAAGEIKESQL